MNIQHFISTLQLPYRGNCPVCAGSNTFSATDTGKDILYYCFKARCKLRGRFQTKLTLDKIEKLAIIDKKPLFNRRDYNFTNALQNRECSKYMDKYGIIYPYVAGVIEVLYDPKRHSCVFILKDHNGIEKGAIGRALEYGVVPKWYVYERIDTCPFIVEGATNKDSVVLVEDCASACNVSFVCSSIALLGTNFNFDLIYLRPYKKIFIALDDDALAKSIDIQKLVNLYRDAKILPIRKDLKYYTRDELKDFSKVL